MLLVIALVAGGWVAVQHDYGVNETPVTIPSPSGPLQGILAVPKGDAKTHGVVVFAHGDGVADAARDGFYRPIWEAFAKAGYASLSWNKPGVGGASGNWLNQSLADRSAEVQSALDWVKMQPGVDTDRLGVWGISQGGWVLPEAIEGRTDVRFMVLVGPAINWLRQGEYNLRQDLEREGSSGSTVAEELSRRSAQIALLERGARYEEYISSGIDPTPMTEDRWGFVLRNFRADITKSLPNISTPTLLVLGQEDQNVDVHETETTYREHVPSEYLTVLPLEGGSHNAAHQELEDPENLKGIFTWIFAPRSIFMPGYLDQLTEFAARHGK